MLSHGISLFSFTCALFIVCMTSVCLSQSHTPLPDDATVLNVKNAAFGAAGDGVTDDTRAINNAIAAGFDARRLIYVPEGTYLISDFIGGMDTTGEADTYSRFYTIHGEGRGKTIFKLKNNCAGYQDSAHPRPAILIFNDKNWDTTTGWSNDCHSVHLLHFSIDVGSGNPGAVGIDLSSHNGGGIEDVEIIAGQGSGKTGLACNRIYPGPSLVNNISITGFDYGIHFRQLHYNMVFEDIILENQKVAAIINQDLSVSMRRVTSRNSVPAVYNTGTEGMMLILDSDFSGGNPDSCAIVSSDVLYLRNVSTSGYKAAVQQNGEVQTSLGKNIGEYLSEDWRVTFPESPRRSLNLPIKETPLVAWDTVMANWQNALEFQNLVTNDDWTPALQAAIDAGKPVVYFPNTYKAGYNCAGTLHVRGAVRRIMGFMANIGGGPVVVDNPDASATILIEQLNIDTLIHNSPATLVARRSLGGSLRAESGAGDLFLDDFVCGNSVFDQANVWIRQYNNEDQVHKITNTGGNLWVLGYKTENATTILFNRSGAATEILGGFIYPLTDATVDMPLYVNDESSLSFLHTYDTTWINDKIRPAYIVEETRNTQVQNVNPDFPRAARMDKLIYVTNPDSVGETGARFAGRRIPSGTAHDIRVSIIDRKRGIISVRSSARAHTVTIMRCDGSRIGAFACTPPVQIVRLGSIAAGIYIVRSRQGTAVSTTRFVMD